jgi:hypothetical protein
MYSVSCNSYIYEYIALPLWMDLIYRRNFTVGILCNSGEFCLRSLGCNTSLSVRRLPAFPRNLWLFLPNKKSHINLMSFGCKFNFFIYKYWCNTCLNVSATLQHYFHEETWRKVKFSLLCMKRFSLPCDVVAIIL